MWRIYIRRILQQNGYTFKNESIELREEHLKLFFRNDYFETVLKYYSDSLTFKRWVILISPANYTWITSDNPGFSFNYTNLKPDKTSPKINPLWTDIEYDTLLYFPLTRKYCLLIEPYKKNDDVKLNLSNDKINFKRSNVTETQIINSWTALSANEYILSSELIELAEFETFLNCT